MEAMYRESPDLNSKIQKNNVEPYVFFVSLSFFGVFKLLGNFDNTYLVTVRMYVKVKQMFV